MADKQQWITVNGTHIPVGKNGDLQGKIGNKIEKPAKSKIITPYQKPAKSFSEYLKENGNDKEKAAHQFFMDNLQNRSVQTKINGIEADILFTGGTWREFKQCIGSQKHCKAEFLEDVPDVLQHYKDKGGLKHSSNVFSDFHYFENTIEKEINGKPVKAKVSVDVGTRKDDKTLQAHSYFVSTDRAIEKEKSHDEHWRITHYQSNEHRKGLPPRLSSMAFDKTIRPQFEVVNIGIEVLKNSATQNMAQDMNAIKKEIREEMRATELAVREVMPLAGEFDSMAFDSAGQVYLKACRFLGVQATVQSTRDVYRAVFAAKSGMISGECPAMDSKPINGFQSRFDR